MARQNPEKYSSQIPQIPINFQAKTKQSGSGPEPRNFCKNLMGFAKKRRK